MHSAMVRVASFFLASIFVCNLGASDAEAKSRRYSRSQGAHSGIASWYGPGFHGRKTASGERFNTNAMTAAHKRLPFGTKVRVTNHRNNRSVVRPDQ